MDFQSIFGGGNPRGGGGPANGEYAPGGGEAVGGGVVRTNLGGGGEKSKMAGVGVRPFGLCEAKFRTEPS